MYDVYARAMKCIADDIRRLLFTRFKSVLQRLDSEKHKASLVKVGRS